MGNMKKCKYCRIDIPSDAKICPNCKKKQGLKFWQIVLIIFGVLVILGTIIDRVEYIKDPKAYTESSIARKESESREREENQKKSEEFWDGLGQKAESIKVDINAPIYTINSKTLDTSNPYWTFVRGTLTANKDRQLVSVKAEFYDANGVVLCQSSDYIGNIEKGKTYQYNIMATCDAKQIASYKIIEP